MPTTKELRSLQTNIKSQQSVSPKKEIKNNKIYTSILDGEGKRVKLRVF